MSLGHTACAAYELDSEACIEQSLGECKSGFVVAFTVSTGRLPRLNYLVKCRPRVEICATDGVSVKLLLALNSKQMTMVKEPPSATSSGPPDTPSRRSVTWCSPRLYLFVPTALQWQDNDAWQVVVRVYDETVPVNEKKTESDTKPAPAAKYAHIGDSRYPLNRFFDALSDAAKPSSSEADRVPLGNDRYMSRAQPTFQLSSAVRASRDDGRVARMVTRLGTSTTLTGRMVDWACTREITVGSLLDDDAESAEAPTLLDINHVFSPRNSSTGGSEGKGVTSQQCPPPVRVPGTDLGPRPAVHAWSQEHMQRTRNHVQWFRWLQERLPARLRAGAGREPPAGFLTRVGQGLQRWSLFYILATNINFGVFLQTISWLTVRWLHYPTHLRWLQFLQKSFLAILVYCFNRHNNVALQISGDVPLEGESALCLPNHLNHDWSHMYSLGSVMNHIGDVRTVLKRETLLVPGFGLGMWYNFWPFLRRKSSKDIITLTNICNTLRKYQVPNMMYLFPEGTRITPERLVDAREFAHSRGFAKLPEHTLVPRHRGVWTVLNGMRGSSIKYVYDMTIACEGWDPAQTKKRFLSDHRRARDRKDRNTPVLPMSQFPVIPSVGQLISTSARRNYVMHLHLRKWRLDELPSEMDDVKRWLHGIFRHKEALLAHYQEHGHFPSSASLADAGELSSESKSDGTEASTGADGSANAVQGDTSGEFTARVPLCPLSYARHPVWKKKQGTPSSWQQNRWYIIFWMLVSVVGHYAVYRLFRDRKVVGAWVARVLLALKQRLWG